MQNTCFGSLLGQGAACQLEFHQLNGDKSEKIINWTEETASIHLQGIIKTCSIYFYLALHLHFCSKKYVNSCMKNKDL